MMFMIEDKKYFISADKSLWDLEFIFDSLKYETYWGRNFEKDKFQKALKNSLIFGVYDLQNKQVGFCRVITDHLTLGYITDTFIVKTLRGKGLGHLLIKHILEYPDLLGVKRWLLYSRIESQGLYLDNGFKHLKNPDLYLEISEY